MQIFNIGCSRCHTTKNVILTKLTKKEYQYAFKLTWKEAVRLLNEDDSDIPMCNKCLKWIRIHIRPI